MASAVDACLRAECEGLERAVRAMRREYWMLRRMEGECQCVALPTLTPCSECKELNERTAKVNVEITELEALNVVFRDCIRMVPSEQRAAIAARLLGNP